MSEQPNIVLVMADQHRADMLGCAGDPVIKTPHIDQLAREGVRFERAYCQGPLCMPARASVLTERFVRDHGVFENSSQVADGTPTFLHRIRDAGYHTAEIGKMHLWPHGQRQVHSTAAMRELMVAYGFDEPIETVGKLASRALRYSLHRLSARARPARDLPRVHRAHANCRAIARAPRRGRRIRVRSRSRIIPTRGTADARRIGSTVTRAARRFSCGWDFRGRIIRGTRRARRSTSIATRKFRCRDRSSAPRFRPPVRSTCS